MNGKRVKVRKIRADMLGDEFHIFIADYQLQNVVVAFASQVETGHFGNSSFVARKNYSSSACVLLA